MFDRDVSKALVVVKDFRVSETSMDGDSSSPERSGAELDPADITSVVRWDYALDFMTPENISRVVTDFPSQDRLAEVFRFQTLIGSFTLSNCITDALNRFSGWHSTILLEQQ